MTCGARKSVKVGCDAGWDGSFPGPLTSSKVNIDLDERGEGTDFRDSDMGV